MADLSIWILLGLLVGSLGGWAYTRPAEVAAGFRELRITLLGLPAYVCQIWQRGW